MTELVLGAGPLGVSLARILRAAGRDVELYSIMGDPAYDMPGTSPDQVNGTDARELAQICDGAQTMYLCLNAHYVDWYRLFPPRLDAAIDAAATVGATLVYHDTAHMYRPGHGPLTEATPPTATTQKGRLRAEMARTLLDAARASKIRGVVGRSADMYGPGALNSSFNSTLGERHFSPLLAGRSVKVVGNIDRPHTYAFVDDVANGLATLAQRHEALGQIWHLPAAPTRTHRELLTLAFDVAEKRPSIRGSRVSSLVVRAIGRVNRDVGEVAEILDQFDKPFVLSHERFADAFGAHPTPHRTALGTTLAWYRTNPAP